MAGFGFSSSGTTTLADCRPHSPTASLPSFNNTLVIGGKLEFLSTEGNPGRDNRHVQAIVRASMLSSPAQGSMLPINTIRRNAIRKLGLRQRCEPDRPAHGDAFIDLAKFVECQPHNLRVRKLCSTCSASPGDKDGRRDNRLRSNSARCQHAEDQRHGRFTKPQPQRRTERF